MQQIQWQDRFNIGVEIVDQAHRRLFSIVEKIMELYVERHEDRFACVEGIKYFKAYAVKHFAEEEAYMREIGYPGYLVHKRLHDRMRRETLPALERELYASDFSTEAVQHFIGVCIGWLTGHIMIEDRTITGEHAALLRPPQDEDERSLIQAVIAQSLIQRAAAHFGLDSDACRVEGVRLLDARTYHASLQAHAPQYSLLFGAGQDRFALCIHRLPAEGGSAPHDRPA